MYNLGTHVPILTAQAGLTAASGGVIAFNLNSLSEETKHGLTNVANALKNQNKNIADIEARYRPPIRKHTYMEYDPASAKRPRRQ